MDTVALMVRLKPKEGREAEVEKFLREAMPFVEREGGTSTWHALRTQDGTYIIFDTFPDEPSRHAHLNGEVARGLREKGAELFEEMPVIENLDIIAVKMPEVLQY